jgi:hypothetical protein
LQDHLTGKQYLGWKKIRETYAEIMKARDERLRGPIEPEPRHRSSSRDYRDREAGRERESGRERERERDSERGRERGSSREYRGRDERDYRSSRDRDFYDRCGSSGFDVMLAFVLGCNAAVLCCALLACAG